MSPTTRVTVADWPPNRRTALCAIALNAGCRSPAEVLMRHKISAVAASRSRALASSRSRCANAARNSAGEPPTVPVSSCKDMPSPLAAVL